MKNKQIKRQSFDLTHLEPDSEPLRRVIALHREGTPGEAVQPYTQNGLGGGYTDTTLKYKAQEYYLGGVKHWVILKVLYQKSFLTGGSAVRSEVIKAEPCSGGDL